MRSTRAKDTSVNGELARALLLPSTYLYLPRKGHTYAACIMLKMVLVQESCAICYQLQAYP
jgi:3,4-dihydroxy-2-butanone 4-phosphate synthase